MTYLSLIYGLREHLLDSQGIACDYRNVSPADYKSDKSL